MYDVKELGPIAPPYGGVTVYLRRLIERLTEDGFTVGGYYTTPTPPDIAPAALFHKWGWFETKHFPWKVFRYFGQLKDYRIIHSHMSLEAMVYLWAFRRILGKKLVITLHNAMVEQYYKSTNAVNKFFLRRLARDRGVVWIACNREGKEQLERLPFRFATEIRVIPAYIPASSHGKALPDALLSYLDGHEKNLVFYGHSFMRNAGADVYGFQEMIKLYALLKKTRPHLGLVYCIADPSDKESVAQLQCLAEELGVKGEIYWQLGGLPSMAGLWNRTDVYVRPTSTDGDSLSVREALEAGAQVVASDVVARPAGCTTYKFGDERDALEMIGASLSLPRREAAGDDSHYEAMKKVYTDLLQAENAS